MFDEINVVINISYHGNFIIEINVGIK